MLILTLEDPSDTITKIKQVNPKIKQANPLLGKSYLHYCLDSRELLHPKKLLLT